jgi:cysteine desulfurase
MNSKRSVYLDHSASTPVDERVLAAMLPYFSEIYGNPHGSHHFGRASEKGVEQARETIAQILNCQPKEIVFTSCGSEGNNLAIRGAAMAARAAGKTPHLITSAVEHSAVIRTVAQMAQLYECEASHVPLTREGYVSPAALAETLRPNTALVSLMYANNEVGTINPIAELAALAHEHGALFHTDAVQAAGQLDLDVQALGVDMLSLSAHKFYGPKGVGALYIRDGLALVPSQTGGSHEEGRRAGTLNVPLIVGMAKALEIAYTERADRVARLNTLREKLITGVLESVPETHLTGSRECRLPSHASFVFHKVDGNQLLMFLDNKGIGASSGSACKTGNPKPSELLMSLGYDESWALGGLRLSLGRHSTAEDVDYTLEVLPKEVSKVRMFAAGMFN